jgi:hypothetical protein
MAKVLVCCLLWTIGLYFLPRTEYYIVMIIVMNSIPFHFDLWIALMLVVGAACGQDGQAGLKKPLGFEDYTPRSLKAIAAMKPDSNSLRDKQDKIMVTADDLRSRVRVTYGGLTRPLPQLKKEVIGQWARLYAGAVESYTEIYQSEMLFIDGGVKFWLAVPKNSDLFSRRSFRKGEPLDLCLIRLGAVIVGDKYDWTLLVAKSRKADTAQDDESWPPLDYLRNDYRSGAVVAHVRTRDAGIIKKIGGYEEWHVVCEVVEPFKGKIGRGDQIEYYHTAEAGLGKEWFTGEKIIFLQRHYYRPEKKWIYAALENSTLPYTKDRVEKLRLISTRTTEKTRRNVKPGGFKKMYMPKVGRKITVEGALDSAKLGLILTFDDGGVYIYPLREADASKMNHFDSLKGQIVKVKGTLRYSRGSSATAAGELSIPEHFFFDAAEAMIITVRPQQR